MRRFFLATAIAVVAVLFAAGSFAAPVTVINPSFEDPPLDPDGTIGNYGGYAPPDWSAEPGCNGGIYDISVNPNWPHTNGDNVWIQFSPSQVGIYQILTETLQPSMEYTLSVDVMAGNLDRTWYAGNELALYAGTGTYIRGYDLGYGGTFEQLNGTLLTGAVKGVDETNLGPDPLTKGQWYSVSMRCVTGPAGSDPNFGEPIKICVRLGTANGTWTAFDNVRLDATAAVMPPAAKPTFSLEPGVYLPPQSVTISCATEGAHIHYTTDGSAPLGTSPVYSTPITVNEDTTIRAMASKDGYLDSEEAQLALIMATGVRNPSFEDPPLDPMGTIGNYGGYAPPDWLNKGGFPDPFGGIYDLEGHFWNASDGDNVWIQFNNGIYQVQPQRLEPNTQYTLSIDVFAGNESNSHYDGNEIALRVGPDYYIRGVDVDGYAGTFDQVKGRLLTGAVEGIDTTNLGPDPLTQDQWYTVSMRCTTGPAGSDPSFGKPIEIYLGIPTSAGWAAFDNVRLSIAPGSAVAKPAFNLASGIYSPPQSVAISCATEGSHIHYTTDNSEPAASSPVYSTPIAVNGDTRIRAMAFKDGYEDSPEVELYLTMTTPRTIYTDNAESGNYAARWLSVFPSGGTMPWSYQNVDPLDGSWCDPYSSSNHVLLIPRFAGSFSAISTTEAGGGLFTANSYTVRMRFISNSSLHSQFLRVGLLNNGISPNTQGAHLGYAMYVYHGGGSTLGTVIVRVNADGTYTELAPFELDPNNKIGFGWWSWVTCTVITETDRTILVYDVEGVKDDGFTPVHYRRQAEDADPLSRYTSGTGIGLSAYGGDFYPALALDDIVVDSFGTPTSLADARLSPDGSYVFTAGTVTASFDGFFYIENADRTCGMRVNHMKHGMMAGQSVDVSGNVLTLPSGEKCIMARQVIDLGAAELIKPLGMTNKSVGGAGVTDGSGLDNTGLFVRTTGKVVQPIGADSFYLEDGSGVPLRAIYTGEYVVLPDEGRYVAVTGASSCEKDGSDVLRVVYVTEWSYAD